MIIFCTCASERHTPSNFVIFCMKSYFIFCFFIGSTFKTIYTKVKWRKHKHQSKSGFGYILFWKMEFFFSFQNVNCVYLLSQIIFTFTFLELNKIIWTWSDLTSIVKKKKFTQRWKNTNWFSKYIFGLNILGT